MSEPIYLTKISIRNLGNLEFFESALGQINLCTGRNQAGKTTISNAIILIFAPGNAPELLRQGTREGWAEITFSDGYKAKKRLFIKEDGQAGYELTVETPEGAEKKGPATFLQQRIPAQSFDVDAYLKMSVDKQAEFLLELTPITFTADEINGALSPKVERVRIVAARPRPGETQEQADVRLTREFYGENAEEFASVLKVSGEFDLERFNELYEQRYSQRTKLNKLKKNLEGACATLESGLSNEDEKDWAKIRDAFQSEIATVEEQIKLAKSEIEREAFKAKTEKKTVIDAKKVEIQRQITELHKQLTAADVELSEYVSMVDRKAAETLQRETATLEQSRASISLELGTARANADRQQQEVGRRMAVESYRFKIAESAASEDDITRSLQALEELKLTKLSSSDIPGLDIKFEKKRPVLTIDGIPFSRINQQNRIVVAIRCLRKSRPKCPFLLVESAELDTDNLFNLCEAIKDCGAQLVAPRWIAGAPLAIMDDEQYKETISK